MCRLVSGFGQNCFRSSERSKLFGSIVCRLVADGPVSFAATGTLRLPHGLPRLYCHVHSARGKKPISRHWAVGLRILEQACHLRGFDARAIVNLSTSLRTALNSLDRAHLQLALGVVASVADDAAFFDYGFNGGPVID